MYSEYGSNSICVMPYMQALAGQPSLRGYDACMVCWIKGGTPEKLQANVM